MKLMSSFLFIKELIRQRRIIFELTRNDFRRRFLGSYLGIVWAFLHPLAYLFTIWFVFEIALHSQKSGDYPYVLWLMAGLFPWFFFSESLVGATSSVIDHTFLVKNVLFPLGMLPIVKILSALIIHMFLVAVLIVLLFCMGYYPTIYWLQLPYYLLATMTLVLGISWLTSAVAVYFRDIVQVVSMSMQFLFWFTPIVWSPDILPQHLKFVFIYNPIYYLIHGYRETFLSGSWFWEYPSQTYNFWLITISVLVMGAVVFRRLRLSFGDAI